MFAPEEQQIDICILKSNLDKIKKELVDQRSMMPALNAVNNQKYRDTKSALQNKRTFNDELERITLENVKLTAHLKQLKRKSNDILERYETAHQYRDKLTESLNQEFQEHQMRISKYEDMLQDKGELFRKSHRYYNEEEVNKETDKVNSVIAELKDERSKKQRAVEEIRAQMDAVHPEVPENLLEAVGKLELEEKMKSITEKYDDLEEERKVLTKQN